jgi:hypothetical protein
MYKQGAERGQMVTQQQVTAWREVYERAIDALDTARKTLAESLDDLPTQSLGVGAGLMLTLLTTSNTLESFITEHLDEWQTI